MLWALENTVLQNYVKIAFSVYQTSPPPMQREPVAMYYQRLQLVFKFCTACGHIRDAPMLQEYFEILQRNFGEILWKSLESLEKFLENLEISKSLFF